MKKLKRMHLWLGLIFSVFIFIEEHLPNRHRQIRINAKIKPFHRIPERRRHNRLPRSSRINDGYVFPFQRGLIVFPSIRSLLLILLCNQSTSSMEFFLKFGVL